MALSQRRSLYTTARYRGRSTERVAPQACKQTCKHVSICGRRGGYLPSCGFEFNQPISYSVADLDGLVYPAASSMRSVISCGWEMSDKWLAFNSIVVAPIRLAMNRSRSGLIVRSSVHIWKCFALPLYAAESRMQIMQMTRRTLHRAACLYWIVRAAKQSEQM